MGSIAQYTDAFVAKWNGRKVSLDGEDINADGRFGVQCMDLWLKFRYGLGYNAWLPTPDAASVWELNNQPSHPMWQFWDGITPDRPAQRGDQFVMNRLFFGNGVGHIGTVIDDLGDSIRVLETNGLGDGYEDEYLNQYGSPARIHIWSKQYLYGYLRWIGPVPDTATVDAVVPAGGATTQLEEDDMPSAEEVAKAVWNFDYTRDDGRPGKPIWFFQSMDAVFNEIISKTAKATADAVLNTKVYDVRTKGKVSLADCISWQGQDTKVIVDKIGAEQPTIQIPADFAEQVQAAIEEKVKNLNFTLTASVDPPKQ